MRKLSIGFVALFFASLFLFFTSQPAFAVTRTWDGGGGDNNWFTAANWSGDTRPGSSDIAQFDSTSTKDSTVDGSFAGSVAGVVITSGYTGTITQSRSLTVGSSNFAQGGGTWSAGSQTLTVNGTFTVSGGTHTATTGTWNVQSDFTYSGGTLTTTGSTLTLTGTTQNSAVTCGGHSAFNLTINKTSTGTTTFADNCTFSNLTRSDGAVSNPASAKNITIQGNFSMSNSDNFGGANLTLTVSGNVGTQTITQNAGTMSGLFVVSKSSGIAQLSTAFITGNTCTVQNGTFYLNGQNFTCGSTFTAQSGITLQLRGNETVTTPTLNSGSAVKYVGDGDGLSDTYVVQNWTYSNLSINATDGTLDTFNFNNDLVADSVALLAGTVGGSGSYFTVNGLLTVNGATWSTNAVIVNGPFSCLSGTVNMSSTWDSNGDFTISGCTYNLSSFSNSLFISGDFIHSSGIFNANTGTTNLDGIDQHVTGSTTFYELIKTATTSSTLYFGAGDTQTITHSWTARGLSGQRLNLRSTSTNSQWLIDPQGTRNLSYLDVKDADNINSTIIQTPSPNSNSSGNNTNWSFTDPFDGGDGSSGDPYQISTCQQLQDMNLTIDLYYKLNQDVDCSMTNPSDPDFNPSGTWGAGDGFFPIGYMDGQNCSEFTGGIDGQSHKVDSLYISRPSDRYTAFIACTGQGSQISNIGFTNIDITADIVVAGIVGDSYGAVSNTYTTGHVTGTTNTAAGVVGTAEYTTEITDSHSSASITGHDYVGGLVGDLYGTIADSYATGNITCHDYCGGLSGSSWSSSTADIDVNNSYATGNVNGNSNVGGLIGENYGKISGSHATGTLTATSTLIGGLVGYSFTESIDSSYATGNVSGTQDVGGLIGEGYTSVSNSYATGDVTGSGNYGVGGLIGDTFAGTITNSYATGNVSGGDYTGGLIGDNWGNAIDSSYATGNVTGGDYVGGFVGDAEYVYPISNSYARGSVTGTTKVGGFAGYANVGYAGTDDPALVRNIYSTGNVNSGVSGVTVGGLIGDGEGDLMAGVNSFWDQQVSGQSSSFAGTGKTTSEMKNQATFTDLSTPGLTSAWDFSTIWAINSSVNSGYPYLLFQIIPPSPTPTPGGGGGGSSGGSSGSLSSSCSAAIPNGTPDLFQINAGADSATLYFAPVSNNVSSYYISYGLSSSATDYGVEYIGAPNGVIEYKVNSLTPGQTYYFKVRAGNGCAAGIWGNVMEINVDGNIYYKNSSIPASQPVSSTIKKPVINSNPIHKEISKNSSIPKPVVKKATVKKTISAPKAKPKPKKNCLLFVCI